MKYLMSADWWRAASIRAAKTMFQTGAALVVDGGRQRSNRGWRGLSWHQSGRFAGVGEGG